MGGGRGPISVDVPTLPTAPFPPPTIGPNPVPAGGTTVDGAAAGLALAANGGVPGDQAASLAGEADRRAHALDAAQKFPANEAQSSQQFQQLAQMLPQMASGLAGSLTGALGGVMGPLTQLPQQAMQAAQSAIQPLMGAAKGGEAAAALTDMSAEEPGFGGAGGGDAGLGGGGGGGVGGGTTPTGFMGPPPVPSSSPPTTPAASSVKPVTVTQTGGMTPQTGPMGMTGMPMMPGGMGAGGDASKDKPAEKRVTVPGIPNGQPVKGRLTVPPKVPVTKSAEGKPPVVAKPNRRIVIVPTDEEAPE
ncbi:hypothetical protein [Mycobacterium sp. 1081908.1]|uniref:hypothetical protein n=1 Tax=Mycobacterium sp. 1081908.1 TaxID=1834066 RepID=UPI0007FCEEDA|nr:hypothetical protein [Mycobacterium sp. 1081908.1]OBK50811.1 hypothetical protein A5655_24475 [Mycobacterium sp. 1081908.1]